MAGGSSLSCQKFEVMQMVARWQFIFSVALVLSLVFPSTAYSRVSKGKSAATRASAKSVSKSSKSSARKSISNKVSIKRVVAKSAAGSKQRRQPIAQATARAGKIAVKKSLRAKTRQIASRKRLKKAPKIAKRYYWTVPMNTTPLDADLSARISAKFQRGLAGRYSPQDLVRAGVFAYSPLRGGIRPRTQQIANLIIHSTETARPADARTVVKSWNHGLSHPGAQFIVDRDGIIHQTVDPTYATIHVNERRTLAGVTNDNSIGIEIVRAGTQKYTAVQLASVVRLVDYIQERYPIRNIYGHGQIQPSTRTDPVAFDWNLFSRNLAAIKSTTTQTAYKEATQVDEHG